jgi:hypothetical protein
MEPWLLDLVVRGAALTQPDFFGPLWLTMNVDGLNGRFSTTRVSVSSGPTWNYAVRLFLNISDINRSYAYFTVCTLGPGGQGTVVLARSRIGLRALPRERAKLFSFPLMRSGSAAQEFAKVQIAAALSHIALSEPIGHTEAPTPMEPSRYRSSGLACAA